jgi:putative transposase
LDVFIRRIIGFGVARADLFGAAICRMFNRIIAGESLPRHLSSDHDPLFRFHRWVANLRILEVDEIKSIPYVPVSHPFVERLVGTIRREFLDQVLIWNAVDLERKLEEFRVYYNDHRSMAVRPENALACRRPPLPSLPATRGGTIAVVCCRCQSRRDYEFAMAR